MADSKLTSLSVAAAEFVPQNYKVYSNLNKTRAHPAVLELRKAIQTLMLEPSEFFEVIVPLSKDLETKIQNQIALKFVIEELYDKSVDDSGFRYFGARMCAYLSQHLTLSCGNFQQELVDRCTKEHDIILTGGGYQSLPHFIGFTLFIGELLVNMENVNEIKSVFSMRLAELLIALTSNQSEAALLCIIQSLKLTGAILDKCEPSIGEVFYELETFLGSPNVPGNIQMQLRSLLDLRSRGWEIEEKARENGNSDKTEIYGDCTEPVSTDSLEAMYFDAYGRGFFLDDVLDMDEVRGNEIDENHPVQYIAGDEVMDAETAEAYEKFILDLPLLPPLRHDDVGGGAWDGAEEMNHVTNGIASLNYPLAETASWQQHQHHQQYQQQQQQQPADAHRMNGDAGYGFATSSAPPEFYRPVHEFHPQNGMRYENVILPPQQMIAPLSQQHHHHQQQQQQPYLMQNYLGYHLPSVPLNGSAAAPLLPPVNVPKMVSSQEQQPSSHHPQYFPQVWLQQ